MQLFVIDIVDMKYGKLQTQWIKIMTLDIIFFHDR